MNDPNGLVWHKGEYHMFFQHNPFGRDWGHMSWGHAVSKDLLTWEELPVAIPEGEDGAIFSGSAVCDGDDLVAIYTRHTETNQSQCIARSKDNGRTFIKYEYNPVLDENKKDFRDPKVFRYKDHWIMSVAQPHDHQISFFSSPDLITLFNFPKIQRSASLSFLRSRARKALMRKLHLARVRKSAPDSLQKLVSRSL